MFWKKPASKLILFSLFLVFSFILHGYTIATVIGVIKNQPVKLILTAYLTGTLFNATAYLFTAQKYRLLFFHISWMLCSVFPLLGNLSALVLFAVKIMSQPKSFDEFESDELSLDDELVVEQHNNQPKSAEEYLRELLDIESFADILIGSNSDLKRSVIEKLAQKDNREAVKLLKQTLKDSDPEIRFHASSGLKKIDENFQRRILTLKEEILLNPQSFDLHLSLGQEYFKFSRSSLADKTTTDFYLNQAWNAIEKALRIKPENISVLLEAGKIKIELGEYEEAANYLDKAINLDSSNWQLRIWRCEANFQIGNITKVKDDCRFIESIKQPWDSVRNITNYWLAYEN